MDGIDRERKSDYIVSVEVKDELGYGQRNKADIYIKILDANDNRPEFLQPRYDAILNSDRTSFTQPLFVKAHDADEIGTPNSKISYEIISGKFQDKFKINSSTGEISIQEPLSSRKSAKFSNSFADMNDKFLPLITLTVRAHDGGIPHQYSTVEVYIHNQV